MADNTLFVLPLCLKIQTCSKNLYGMWNGFFIIRKFRLFWWQPYIWEKTFKPKYKSFDPCYSAESTLFFSWIMPLFLVQPLMDNLEAQTYETFEKDVVKYTQVSAICCEYAFFLYIVYVLKELLSFHVYCKNIKQVWNFELNLLHLCFQIFPFLFNDQLYDFLWWYLPPSSINFLAWTDGPGLAKEKNIIWPECYLSLSWDLLHFCFY